MFTLKATWQTTQKNCWKLSKLHILDNILSLARVILKNWNLGQNIWDKIEKSSKTGRTRKVWYLVLRVFWLLLSKFNFWKEDWALGYVSIQIWDFPSISLLPKILSLKLFGNSWDKYSIIVYFLFSSWKQYTAIINWVNVTFVSKRPHFKFWPHILVLVIFWPLAVVCRT